MHGEYPERVTVPEAAERLGISQHAVRARLSRGTLASERDAEGRVWAYVPADTAGSHGGSHGGTPGYPELVDALRAQIADLQAQLAAERRANEQNRQIIAGLTQRLPQLGAGESGDVGASGPATTGEGSTPRQPWWRRFLQGRPR